jgi:hypothetical protein
MPTPFPFTATRHAATPATETLEWGTDVRIASDGTEQRSSKRAYPRYTYACDIITLGEPARACLQALRLETSFLVPLWPHVFERPDVGPTAGIAASAPQVMQLDYFSAHAEGTAPITWDDAYAVAAPCAVARIDGTQRAMAHITSTESTAKVQFRLIDFEEAVAPYAGAFSPSLPDPMALPLMDPFTGLGGGMSEQIPDNVNAFDNGNLDLVETRYLERIYTLEVVLPTRAQILDFRRLLFALKGRMHPFRWTAPGDAEERIWRLAADSVVLSYLRPGIVKTTLSFKQLATS